MQNISLFEDGSGGSLEYKNNGYVITEALYTAIYVKLFGGNVDESTTKNKNNIDLNFDWWGNDINGDPNEWINSETERILRGTEITPRTMSLVEQAMTTDLKEFEEYGDVVPEVIMTGINKLQLNIFITEKRGKSKIAFTWDQTRKEVIEQITL